MSSRRLSEVHRQQRLLTYAPLALLGAHILLALLYNLNTPFGNNGYPNTPDEGAHFQYVAYVAREWRLPVFEGYEGVGYEAHQPPLYYFLAGILFHLVGGEGKGIRLLSTLASAGVVWLTWLTLRRLFPQRFLMGLVGMAFVAFLPMHIAIGSAVGNDALMNLLFAGVLYGLAVGLTPRPDEQTPNWRLPALLGILTGLTVLTKATAILLFPILLVGFALISWRASKVRGTLWLKETLFASALAFAIALAIGGWWFIRNALLYEDPLLQKTFLRVFAGTAKAEDFFQAGMSVGEYARLVADWTFRSFWFAYGTPQTARTGLPNFLPDSVYWGLLGWCLLALVGLGVWLYRVRRGVEPFDSASYAWLWLGLLTLLLVAGSFVLFVRVFFQTQGRYFYPALMPIAVLLALGWDTLIPERWRPVAHGGLIALWLLLAIGCLRYL